MRRLEGEGGSGGEGGRGVREREETGEGSRLGVLDFMWGMR